MNLIYSNKEVSVYVGKLHGILNGIPYDFSSLYQTSKKTFPSTGFFYPFNILVSDKKETQISLISFVDESFKEFKIQETLAIFVMVHSNNITKENAQQIAFQIIASLDITRILNGVKEYSDKMPKEEYYIAQFCNIDNATEAAHIIVQAKDSYFLKENEKYTLIWSPSNKPDDITLAQVYDFADSNIHSITALQLYAKLKYANDILIQSNAIQHLNSIY